jgi:hypothetical protein
VETLSAGTISSSGGSTTITATATGGTSPYSYNINGGAYQTANTFTGMIAGTYTVTVKDANGCIASKSITLNQPVPLTATAVAGTISCNGGSTSVTVTATGGLAPYTGTGVFTVNAGTFNYIVKDANNVSVTATVTVAQPTAIVETLSAGTISSSGGSTTITATATGGTSPYSYNINGGAYQTANTFTGMIAGTYTVTVKDANGCIASKSIIISQQVAISENDDFKVRVGPNPTKNQFTLSISKYVGQNIVEVTVYNIQGIMVYSTQGNASSSYTFGNMFAPGTYILKVKIGNITKTIKLLKV